MKLIKGSAMRISRRLHQLEAYWEALRPPKDIPNRDDVNPAGFDGIMDEVLILERQENDQVLFRVSGQKHNDLLGVTLESVPFQALFDSKIRPLVNVQMLAVFEKPAILKGRTSSAASIMGGAIKAEFQIMPLRGKSGQIDRALGIIAYDDPVGKSPRLFDQFAASITPLETVSFQQPEPESIYSSVEEEGIQFEQRKGRPDFTERPKLTLIKGGRGSP